MQEKRWALSVPLDGMPLAQIAPVAGEAERLGYTDAWSLEIDGIDGFAPLAAVGATTKMRLGTAIANTYTRGPATLAMSAAGLAEIAPERFCLGIGAGSQPIVESWNGGTFANTPPSPSFVTTLPHRRLVFYDQSGKHKPSLRFGMPAIDHVLLEAKTPPGGERDLTRLLRPLAPRATRSSKYVQSCETFGLTRAP